MLAEGPAQGAVKKFFPRYWLCGLFAVGAIGPVVAASRYDVVPAPSWVEAAVWPATQAVPREDAGGAHYILAEHQLRITGIRSDYVHFVTQLTNATGVENNSQITIDFDPRLEKLHLHAVLLRRGSEHIDQLRTGRIRVLQREAELEDNVLDGDLTFHLLLSDVRIGDIVDYSYTIERRDPQWRNRYYGHYPLQWDDPVDLARVRVSAPLGASLRTLSHGTGAARQWNAGGWQYWEWSIPNGPALRPEAHAPRWIEQHASVEFSQFADWSELANGSVPLFAVSEAPSAELRAISDRLAGQGATPAERAVAVLKFVQEEIRYTGIEEGGGAFKPAAPNLVLKRRYGDCKDKTLLAVVLLRSMGINAAPALVSTRWRQMIGERLPNPGLMNHAVVRAEIAGRPYWFDATTTGQGGQLPNFTQAHFGAALVVKSDTTQLERMPDDTAVTPLTSSHSTFDLRAGLRAETALTVSTQFFGVEADRKRRSLRSHGMADLEKQYLEYYKRRYPGTVSVRPLRVTDDTNLNQLTIDEAYRVSHIFKKADNGKHVLHLLADTIRDSLDAPEPSDRTTPLALDFPTNDTARMTVLLPSAWNITESAEKIDAPAFEYGSKVSYRNNEVTLDYRFHTLADNVPVSQLPHYIKQLDRAKDDVYFDLSYDPDAAPAANHAGALTGLKIVFVFGIAYLAYHLLRYALVVRELLTTTIQHVEVSPCGPEEESGREGQYLMLLDQPLAAAGFQPMGFLIHTPFDTKHDKPERIRVLNHATLPIQAFVSRRETPEYGAYVNLWFETPLADRRILHSTNQVAATYLADPAVLAEHLPNASVSELFTHHKKRLEGRATEEFRPAPFSLSSQAGELAAAVASVRTRLRDKGWLVGSSDPLLDRITLRGAICLAHSSIRAFRARMIKRPPQVNGSREDQALRAEADHWSVSHLARSPRTAPGLNWPLLTLNAGLPLALLAGVAAVTNMTTALLLVVAIALHEVGHVTPLRAGTRAAAPLFLLPLLGILKIDNGVHLSVTTRTEILLAGVLPGLIIAALLLACHLIWTSDYLVATAWVLIFFNGLMLTPLASFDGARLLEGMTRPDAVSRLAVQIASVAALIVMGVEFNSSGLFGIGVVLVFLIPVRFAMYRLARTVAAQISAGADWQEAARHVLIALAMTGPNRSLAFRRRYLAIQLADQFSAPPALRRERLLAMSAYGLSAALAICLAYAARRH